ncbi:MAG: hypothetical protein JKX68_00695 [Flavobacteriales bacterium]|nr:hypothetical protein [Flavobacteriales bacterium]
MNWFVLSACLIVYPLFGLSIYLLRNRLDKIQNFSYVILMPIGLSFVLGVGVLAYAVASM